MSLKKNKELKIPNFKKSISDFLKNESGNVSTSSAITLWALWIASVALSDIAWAVCNQSWWHYNWTTNWHYSWSGTFWATITNVANGVCLGSDVNYTYQNWCTTLTCNPINGIVNGHYNITPSCSSTPISKHCNHISSWDSWDSWDGWDSCG